MTSNPESLCLEKENKFHTCFSCTNVDSNGLSNSCVDLYVSNLLKSSTIWPTYHPTWRNISTMPFSFTQICVQTVNNTFQKKKNKIKRQKWKEKRMRQYLCFQKFHFELWVCRHQSTILSRRR